MEGASLARRAGIANISEQREPGLARRPTLKENPETKKFECTGTIPIGGTNLCVAPDSAPICSTLYPGHEPQRLREAREGCVSYSCIDSLASSGCTADSLDYCYDYKCGAWSEAAPPPIDPVPTLHEGIST